MKKFISVVILALASLPSFASEIPANLHGVADLKHPNDRLYLAGQPVPDDFAAFATAGVTKVINLRAPAETPDVNEAAIVTHAGMAYYNIPINGMADLTLANVKLLDHLLTEFGSEKILLHCSSGNRVAALMTLRAAWIQHASTEDAMKLGASYGLTKLSAKVRELLAEPVVQTH